MILYGKNSIERLNAGTTWVPHKRFFFLTGQSVFVGRTDIAQRR